MPDKTEDREYITPAEAFIRWCKGEKSLPPELKAFNPLELKPEDTVIFKTMPNYPNSDLDGENCAVTMVDVYRMRVGDKIFEHVDYWLHEPVRDIWLVLRVNPVQQFDSEEKRRFGMMVLYPDKKMHYHEDGVKSFHKKILPTGTLEVKLGDGRGVVFERVNGVKEPVNAEVTEFKKNEKPTVEEWQYWDYVREVDGGNLEFYFVEMKKGVGEFQTYFGIPISQDEMRLVRRKV